VDWQLRPEERLLHLWRFMLRKAHSRAPVSGIVMPRHPGVQFKSQTGPIFVTLSAETKS
jgi:hypothetical protein